ncbi:CheR family methyltransferase [Noviherbaspirillum galbum]|uniref:Chemotaxis protein n=1 Tax=Noviherbaspirillum galbum TaxID=2709383 RepID=A0A6B3SWB4_9BURK|nr:CheR family methyltransferase [Noviherbaspirillum galbum]NEX61969.1 chemotaxis protein [Noviherbaspirillum galbum]
MSDDPRAIESLETDLLLEGVFQRFGLDYRGYRRETVRRKLQVLMRQEGVQTISGLQEKMMHDAPACQRLLLALGSRPAGLLADADRMFALRRALVPWLRSCASPRVWVAECASAEDVAGLAILLEEEGLHGKTQIFATTACEAVLDDMRACRFPAERLEEYAGNHLRSGGKGALSQYVAVRGGEAVFAEGLCSNVVWAQYSLATDASFNEFQLITCHGALTEFGAPLRNRALQLFHESMPMFGLLSVELAQEADLASFRCWYRPMNEGKDLYRRVA